MDDHLDKKNYLTEWEFSDGRLLLRVDENSSPEELEDEAEFWLNEARDSLIPDTHKQAIMKACRWMMMIAEENGS